MAESSKTEWGPPLPHKGAACPWSSALPRHMLACDGTWRAATPSDGMHWQHQPLCGWGWHSRKVHWEFLEEAYSSASHKWKVHLQRAFSFVVQKERRAVLWPLRNRFSGSLECGALWGKGWGLYEERKALGRRLDALVQSSHLLLYAHTSSLPVSAVTLELLRPKKPTAWNVSSGDFPSYLRKWSFTEELNCSGIVSPRQFTQKDTRKKGTILPP